MKRKSTNKQNSDYSLAHVLYQKLGNDWYAFTEVDGDCFMSKVDAEAATSARASNGHETNDANAQPRKRRAA